MHKKYRRGFFHHHAGLISQRMQFRTVFSANYNSITFSNADPNVYSHTNGNTDHHVHPYADLYVHPFTRPGRNRQ